eukprot:TRINITY_DN2551_c0_g1_i13.p2 TRINITY_DN2551_c0_g1~~TRINITY_DN2551_c0_g1_i13.p2  ORF type:complete len:125 (+),score=1.95 TRINITY_DN2551_c0_g1_i13:44-418(+)
MFYPLSYYICYCTITFGCVDRRHKQISRYQYSVNNNNNIQIINQSSKQNYVLKMKLALLLLFCLLQVALGYMPPPPCGCRSYRNTLCLKRCREERWREIEMIEEPDFDYSDLGEAQSGTNLKRT